MSEPVFTPIEQAAREAAVRKLIMDSFMEPGIATPEDCCNKFADMIVDLRAELSALRQHLAGEGDDLADAKASMADPSPSITAEQFMENHGLTPQPIASGQPYSAADEALASSQTIASGPEPGEANAEPPTVEYWLNIARQSGDIQDLHQAFNHVRNWGHALREENERLKGDNAKCHKDAEAAVRFAGKLVEAVDVLKIERAYSDRHGFIGWRLTIQGREDDPLIVFQNQSYLEGFRSPTGPGFSPDIGETIEYRPLAAYTAGEGAESTVQLEHLGGMFLDSEGDTP